MKIEHVAIWTRNIEKLKVFYTDYFGGIAGEKYENSKKSFESYFIKFDSGARLELMQMPTIPLNLNDTENQHMGLIHIAISVGSIEKVNSLTDELMKAGCRVISQPRYTGDGYYESCILDPDGNRLELTV
ncbi:Glyoxalase/bleomycin resistance protein/dioxygenase [Alkaliphilus metalliredigens QYMF]|uniref:Glyoxalase/bleomycin resistance protein/dioxygenase n=1 Tax=Alkaliphilus metalliredigens (strain QYMF) TaxID=293826 RepID=A6TN66_ALKMQ|nr:VOC family protein [Alkaliphilus metalliredigens]ABR47634.1 Glyoxalase/bleomycin resistance protein/dioxygenase [Alkaliphilus metalliredigens QYMF]